MATPTTSGEVTFVPYSGTNSIDGLLGGTKWGSGGAGVGATVAYSIPEGDAWFATPYGFNEPSGYSSLNSQQSSAFEAALQTWAEVANITFVELPDTDSTVGDVRIAFSTVVTAAPGTSAWAYLPANYPEAGDIWLNPAYAPNLNPVPGNEGFSTLVHEIGHALGLHHPFEGAFVLPSHLDTHQYTVMSYDTSTPFIPAQPMLLDVQAIQYLYGPNMTTRAGDTRYTFDASSEQISVIWDAGGTDWIEAPAAGSGSTIYLTAGLFSQIGTSGATKTVAVAYGASIENAQGSDSGDYIYGSTGGNTIYGAYGVDVLSGQEGRDFLYGNQDGDILYGGSGEDWVHGGQGQDALYGNQDNDELFGGKEADWVHGGKGDDYIVGGNGLSDPGDLADELHGGVGSDSIFGNAGGDTLYGEWEADYIHGGRGDDQIYGGDGGDHLAGGTGADTLVGGAGVDYFYTDEFDTIVDLEAHDVVWSNSDWTFI